MLTYKPFMDERDGSNLNPDFYSLGVNYSMISFRVRSFLLEQEYDLDSHLKGAVWAWCFGKGIGSTKTITNGEA